MPTTANYGFTTPTIGSATDTWGGLINDAFDGVDAQLFRVEGLVSGKLNLTGGTLTGILNGTSIILTTSLTAPAIVGTLTGNVIGNATTSTTLSTPRNFSLTGIVTASAQSFNGSANVVLTTAIADAALSIAKTSGLQAALDGKEPTVDADRKRKITISTADPSGGSDGDIWFKYTA